MKFSADRKLLAASIASAASVAVVKTGVPVLSQVRIDAVEEGNVVRVTATNLEVTLVDEVEAQVKKSGSILVRAGLLADVLREMDGDSVEVVMDAKKRVRVKSGESSMETSGLDVEVFPDTPVAGSDAVKPASIPLGKFLALVRFSLPVVAHKTSSFDLEAGRFLVRDGKMRLLATDGHRISIAEEPVEKVKRGLDYMLSLKGMRAVDGEASGEVSVGSSDARATHVSFRTGSRVVWSRRPEVEFPDCDSAVERAVGVDKERTTVVVKRGVLESALKRIALVSSTGTYNAIVKLPDKSNKTVGIDLANADLGEATEVVGLESEQRGPSIALETSVHYLLESMQSLSGYHEVRLSWGPSGVVVITPAGDKQHERLVLVAGMKR